MSNLAQPMTLFKEIPAPLPHPEGEFSRTLRVVLRSKTAVLGALLLGFYVLIALLAPVLVLHNPNQQNLALRLTPPFGLGLPRQDIQYPLGTDNLGRDILSRLVTGSRISLAVGLTTVVLASLFGSVVGAVAGFFRGWFDHLTMRLVDIWMAFPSLLLAIAFGAAFGQGLVNLVLALVLTNWVVYGRLVRSAVLVLRESDYVVAARVLGASDLHILVRHIVPNLFSLILVISTLQLGIVIITEASLSFLGISAQSTVATWGGMLADGREFMRQAWWLSTFPGIAISVMVLAANLFGDGLRDALDPRLR